VALVGTHQDALRRLRLTTGVYVASVWAGLGSYDEADVAPFVERVVPVVVAAQRRAAALTVVYLARRLGTPPARVDLTTFTGPGARNGTPPADVYRRPFVTVWAALANGTPWSRAVDAGGARARSAATTDVQLAFRESAREVMGRDDRIVGYERVPSGDACDLCDLASTQRYHTGDLMPIHNNCGCDVEPIFGQSDPGHIIHPERLAAIRAAGTDVAVHEHGELGPVLTAAGDQFTAESDF
jgi:hypothetical protein